MYIDLKEIKLPERARVEVSRVVNDGLKTVYVYMGDGEQVFINQRGSDKQLVAKFEKRLKKAYVLVALEKAGLLKGVLHSISK